MHRLFRCLVACAGILGAGCYAYVPTTTRPLVGRIVETRLTDSGSVILASRVGPAIEQLRGRVVTDTPVGLSLAVQEAINRDGLGTAWRNEVVDVPRPLIHEVAVRQFSPSRTALFTLLTSTVLIAVERGFIKSGGSNAAGSSQSGTPTGR